MKDDLRKLLISDTEMHSASGFAGILDALHQYRNGMNHSVDSVLRLVALIGAVGMTVLAAIAFAVAASTGGGWLGYLPGAVLTATAGALFCTRLIDFEKRHLHGKYGQTLVERYQQYRSPLGMQQRLYADVERFNKLVRAIHVSDEIDAAGLDGAKIEDRAAVLRSMALTRTDLLRALKIERIMRENADVSNADFQLFNIDLSNLAAMQVEDAASQQGKLMNEAFRIARDVQSEVRKLQTQDRQAV